MFKRLSRDCRNVYKISRGGEKDRMAEERKKIFIDKLTAKRGCVDNFYTVDKEEY